MDTRHGSGSGVASGWWMNGAGGLGPVALAIRVSTKLGFVEGDFFTFGQGKSPLNHH